MKCPLRYIETHYPDEQIGRDQLDCLQEECAWFDDTNQECDPTGLKPLFIAIGNTLGVIADRMPKDLAPRG